MGIWGLHRLLRVPALQLSQPKTLHPDAMDVQAQSNPHLVQNTEYRTLNPKLETLNPKPRKPPAMVQPSTLSGAAAWNAPAARVEGLRILSFALVLGPASKLGFPLFSLEGISVLC